jgi:hypothetical protein
MNAHGEINTDPDPIAADAHEHIRPAYYGITDHLHTMINVAELKGDQELKDLCRNFGKTLYDQLEEKHPNWD